MKTDQIIKGELAKVRGELFFRFDNETASACLLELSETLCQSYGVSMGRAFDLACAVEPRVKGYR